MSKINIIQFLPYFPPHKWWVETVVEEFSYFYVQKWYGEVINVVTNPSSILPLILIKGEKKEYIKTESWKIIWYKQKWYSVYLLPAFDIISNFPVPKFWKKEFWEILWKIKYENALVQTHTRFFLSSLLWGLFAKYHKLKWIHVEHWSDYVKSGSKLVEKVSYIYDKLIWTWIFKKADRIVAISNWVKDFINREFSKREIEIIYNWINFLATEKQENKDLIKIWFVWRLVKLKWINLLLEVFSNLSKKYENIVLEIVWDGEERQNLENQITDLWLENKVKFHWLQDREYVKWFLSWTDILVNPSFQEWLPTTVLEWLLSSCVVVASDVWWTKEISDLEDLIIIEKWNLESLEKWLEKAILNYESFAWKSKNLILERFDWNSNIEKYFNLYEKM